MRVLVLGGSGFIGSHLVKALQPDHHVTVVDVHPFPFADARMSGPLDFVLADVTEPTTIGIMGCRAPDLIINLVDTSGISSGVSDIGSIILGSYQAAMAASIRRVRYLYVSSWGVAALPSLWRSEGYGSSSSRDLCQQTAEQYLKILAVDGLQYCVLRMSSVYGPQRPPGRGVVARWIADYLDGRSPAMYGSGSQARDFLHVDDAVRAIEALIPPLRSKWTAYRGQVYNACTGRQTALCDLYRLMKKVIPLRPVDWRKDVPEGLSGCEMRPTVDGWRAEICLPEGLRRTVRETTRLWGKEPTNPAT